MTTPARPAARPAANASAPQPTAKAAAKAAAPQPVAKPAAKAPAPQPVAKPAANAPAPPPVAKPTAKAAIAQPAAKPEAKAPAPPPADAAKRAEAEAEPDPAPATPAAGLAKAMAAVGVVAGASAAISSRLGDLALIGAGVATAAAAVTFAGAMILQGNHAPNINGLQYLAIFAQPSNAGRRPTEPAPLSTAIAAAPEPQATVDMAPVGAISAKPPPPHPLYELLSAGLDRAWVRDGDRIFAVHIGDNVPNLGKIEDIEWTDGHWALIGVNNVTLLTSGEAAAPKKNGAGGFPQRKMIFGGDQ